MFLPFPEYNILMLGLNQNHLTKVYDDRSCWPRDMMIVLEYKTERRPNSKPAMPENKLTTRYRLSCMTEPGNRIKVWDKDT